MRAKLTIVAALLLSGCASDANTYRPNRPLNDHRQFAVACDSAHDQAPKMVYGKSPVFPVGMLNPYVIDERKTRHLPMEWEVTTTFDVAADGRTRNVHSTATDPQSFSDHMTVAVRAWRFTPAMAGDVAVESRCEVNFRYALGG
jgi:uncharacterized lipoprotein YmbA